MITIILSALAFIFAGISAFFSYKAVTLLKAIKDIPQPKIEPEKAAGTVDDKASNAERLYMEGIQNVLSFDVDTVKKYLRGADES